MDADIQNLWENLWKRLEENNFVIKDRVYEDISPHKFLDFEPDETGVTFFYKGNLLFANFLKNYVTTPIKTLSSPDKIQLYWYDPEDLTKLVFGPPKIPLIKILEKIKENCFPVVYEVTNYSDPRVLNPPRFEPEFGVEFLVGTFHYLAINTKEIICLDDKVPISIGPEIKQLSKLIFSDI